jgi:hypothetical protein
MGDRFKKFDGQLTIHFHQNFQDFSGLFRTFQDFSGLFRTFQDFSDFFGPFALDSTHCVL